MLDMALWMLDDVFVFGGKMRTMHVKTEISLPYLPYAILIVRFLIVQTVDIFSSHIDSIMCLCLNGFSCTECRSRSASAAEG